MKPNYQHQSVKRIAAIDLGTNSFHAVIVDVFPDGSFYTVDKLKEMVLLAEKGFGSSLSPAAMDRGIQALKKIKMLCDHQKAQRIMAYATSAIREAENGGEFIQRAIDEVGIKINAISGRLEAELIGYSIQHGMELGSEPVLAMDIGGGSVEFILCNNERFFHLASKKIGVARMAAAHVDNDPITPQETDTLRDVFRDQLQDVAQAFAQHRSHTLIGSSGTMENIALMIAARNNSRPNLSVNELSFSASEFFDFYDDVITMTHSERSTLSGLDEKRIDLIAPGLVLVHYVLKTFSIKKVRISSQALREGIILRHIRKEMDDIREMPKIENPRLRSVMELLFKYDWHEDHSRHVARLAEVIFDKFADDLGLNDRDRELLHYACLLHDIGYFISHRKHHKHALYIIRHSELLGFKEDEIEMLANIARYHRRSTPKKRHSYFSNLPKEIQKRITKLAAILRVADGLDRSHYQNVRSVQIEKSKNAVEFMIETEADPQLEIWGAMRKRTLFEEVTGKKLTIHSRKAMQTV
ncbi:MAG: HD domain-containing protein [Balneolaceae bacterium]